MNGRKNLVISGFLLVIITLALIACSGSGGGGSAAAPQASIALGKTGQTASYATGDDGALLKGVAWPSPRFTSNTDTTVTDNLTGLVWAPDASSPTVVGCTGGVMNWQNSLNYVACLNTNSYLNHTDWRLPNRKELRSLVNCGQAIVPNWLNSQGFTSVQASYYWTSTTTANNTVYAWVIGMNSGSLSGDIKTNNGDYTWPVRTGSISAAPANLPQTGQTTSYAVGDDGALQVGVALPNQRFTTNSDTTETDNLTGLVWAPIANSPTVAGCTGGGMTWQNTLTYVACLNTNNYLNHNDWRLPNVNEMESLVNAGQGNDATWLNSQGFTNVQASYYWSSTTLANSTAYAWAVGMYGGDAIYILKTSSYYAWPVRAGKEVLGPSIIWS